MDRRRWLEIAECLSLLGLIAGSIAAVASGQLIYACVPVVISICLNFVNRSQFERLIEHRQQQIFRELQLQRQQFTDFNLKLLSAEIANLQQQYASLQQAYLTLSDRLALLTQELALDGSLSDSDPDDEGIDALLDSLD